MGALTDIPETSPYYFIAKDSSGNILSEGELAMFKIKLPDKYLYSEFKSIVYDKSNMTAIVQFWDCGNFYGKFWFLTMKSEFHNCFKKFKMEVIKTA